jgi:hypothetical protein
VIYQSKVKGRSEDESEDEVKPRVKFPRIGIMFVETTRQRMVPLAT